MNDEMGTDRPFGHGSPELAWPRTSPNTIDVPTKAGDMYAFGGLAYEVRTDFFPWYYSVRSQTQILAGESAFSKMTEVAAKHMMFSGLRPPRPDNHRVSNVVWKMVQSCWDPVGPRRMLIEEVVALLEAELGDTTTGPY